VQIIRISCCCSYFLAGKSSLGVNTLSSSGNVCTVFCKRNNWQNLPALFQCSLRVEPYVFYTNTNVARLLRCLCFTQTAEVQPRVPDKDTFFTFTHIWVRFWISPTGLSFVAEQILTHHMQKRPWRHLADETHKPLRVTLLPEPHLAKQNSPWILMILVYSTPP
jgi:hypothetical protein